MRTYIVLLALLVLPMTGCLRGTGRQALTTFHTFSGADGSRPISELVQGNDGSFYGTTFSGGEHDWGTVFAITPTGSLRTLYHFSGGNDGRNPDGGLVRASDGNYYGTTVGGGTQGWGTVFKISPAGTLATLYNFSGHSDRGGPGKLIRSNDGCFYGTTIGNWGTVYKIDLAGKLTTLWQFSGGADGCNPDGVLVQGGDGNLYGTTGYGGKLSYGTVFKISPEGKLTTLYQFGEARLGSDPTGLVLGADGNFYGSTVIGGKNGHGMIFKITSTGTLTALHHFCGYADGEQPATRLVQGSDGYFYGTTRSGGVYGLGTLFRISPAGSLTVLHHFSNPPGNHPSAGLIQGKDGCLYGTTDEGTHNRGTVFKFSISTNVPPYH